MIIKIRVDLAEELDYWRENFRFAKEDLTIPKNKHCRIHSLRRYARSSHTKQNFFIIDGNFILLQVTTTINLLFSKISKDEFGPHL